MKNHPHIRPRLPKILLFFGILAIPLLLLYFKLAAERLPPVRGVPVATVDLKKGLEGDWAFLRTKSFSIRVPFEIPDVEIEEIQEIVDQDRAVVLLGAAPTHEGEPFLFEEQILAIDDGSLPDDRRKNPVNVTLDMYRFDSNSDENLGKYRDFLHFTSSVFRRKDIDRVLAVEGLGGPFQLVVYEGYSNERWFVYCEIFSVNGNAIGRLKFLSNRDDTDWIYRSIATIDTSR